MAETMEMAEMVPPRAMPPTLHVLSMPRPCTANMKSTATRMWPAVMLAKSRKASATGLMTVPMISMGTSRSEIGNFVPAVRCERYPPRPSSLMPARLITSAARIASEAVTKMFCVAVAPRNPENACLPVILSARCSASAMGTRPSRLLTRMKKNTVHRKGMKRSVRLPKSGRTLSSRR